MAGRTVSGKDAHHDRPLTNLAIAAFQRSANFIGQQVMPIVPVGKESDEYYILDPDSWLRTHNDRRARKGKARRIEFRVSSDAYKCKNYALSGDNALEDLDNADTPLALRQNTTDLVVEALLRNLELRVANLVTSGGNMGSGTTLTGANQWTSTNSADIIAQVNTGHAFIRSRTGLRANTLIVDYDSYQLMRQNAFMLAKFSNVSGGFLTDDQIRSLLGVERILVGDAIRNSALEEGGLSLSNVWGDNAVLCRIENNPRTIKSATVGLGFRWRPNGFPQPMRVDRQVFAGAGTENIEVIEAGYWQDERIVAPDLGYVISDTQA